MVELYREVVDEGADDPAHVRHDPRDPEEVVGRGEGLVAEAGHQGQEAAEGSKEILIFNELNLTLADTVAESNQ